MKIGDLEQHCGNCMLIDLCGAPFSDICLCCNEELKKLTEKEYIVKVNEIRNNAKRNWSNKSLEKIIIQSLKMKEDNNGL